MELKGGIYIGGISGGIIKNRKTFIAYLLTTCELKSILLRPPSHPILSNTVKYKG